jgi:hypothetical protein
MSLLVIINYGKQEVKQRDKGGERENNRELDSAGVRAREPFILVGDWDGALHSLAPVFCHPKQRQSSRPAIVGPFSASASDHSCS